MKLEKFKEDCEEVGIDFELVRKYYEDQSIPEDGSFKDWVTASVNSVDAFMGAFVWEDTPEGHAYWERLCGKLKKLR